VDREFAINVAGMDFDCSNSNEKPVSDLTVGQPLGYKTKNLALTLAEWFDQHLVNYSGRDAIRECLNLP
jgi:hypothetical protein